MNQHDSAPELAIHSDDKSDLEIAVLETLAPEPAGKPMLLVKGHALEHHATSTNLQTLCSLRLAWGRVTEESLPRCPKCRDELMKRAQAR